MDLAISHLYKAFNGRPVLADFSHVFPECSLTCVFGPSGCGKTTLLNLMLRLVPADSGKITGFDPRRVAAVFQEDRLIKRLSPEENLRLVLRSRDSVPRIRQALAAVGLGDAAGQPAATLSGGMKRRVALLRAVLTDADVLLLDEPFKGLDPVTRRQVIDFVRPLLTNRTVVLVTHDAEETALLGGQILDLGKITGISDQTEIPAP